MKMKEALRNYLVITGGYWAFTVTDGAIRMLVLLYFHQLGYSPLEVAMLFLFYEFFGVVTNMVGGKLGARIGLNLTMHIGMGMQICALGMLTVPESYLSVAYVMAAQALSGIAKDLNKMSAKASVKTLVSGDDNSKLFKWVAVLTGSKNALKGAGFFVGGFLLQSIGFRGALLILASLLLIVLIFSAFLLPKGLGTMKSKPAFSKICSEVPAINWLSGARFFLFGSRDVWFVVGVPVFLYEALHWSFTEVGTFLALWVVGYGAVQGIAPNLIRGIHHNHEPDGSTARTWGFILAFFPAGIALGLQQGWSTEAVLISGLILFGVVFAVNSSVHSYLVLAYSDLEHAAMNVGFYYMANAGGRLVGTLISGWSYQTQGLVGCLCWSSAFVVIAGLLSFGLPDGRKTEEVEKI